PYTYRIALLVRIQFLGSGGKHDGRIAWRSTPPPPRLPPPYLTVVSLAVLLLVSGSTGSTAATDAVLVTVPFLVARTTIAAVADPPSPRSPSAQPTVVFCALQRPWLAVADLNRTLRSSVSVRLTPRAVSKPLFLTVTV